MKLLAFATFTLLACGGVPEHVNGIQRGKPRPCLTGAPPRPLALGVSPCPDGLEICLNRQQAMAAAYYLQAVHKWVTDAWLRCGPFSAP